jgi:uncharacterized membrane protein YtjA (UPF0391 family)
MWAPIFLLLSLIAALFGFTGILGEEVMGPSRVAFFLFVALFFGAAMRTPTRQTASPS